LNRLSLSDPEIPFLQLLLLGRVTRFPRLCRSDLQFRLFRLILSHPSDQIDRLNR
jgi:hypothetical protein